MRAAATLHLLSRWAPNVHLLVVPIYPTGAVPDPDIASLCTSWHIATNPGAEVVSSEPWSEWQRALVGWGLRIPDECRSHNAEWQEKITTIVGGLSPDLVIVFRFYLADFILPAVNGTIPVWLDIDELESNSRARLGGLYDVVGDRERKEQLNMDALAYTTLESRYLPRFQRIFAASDAEGKSVLSAWSDADVRTLPNVYPAIRPQPVREAEATAVLLYVGTFGYYPNRDAIDYFCAEILPRIRERASLPVRIVVVGTGLQALGEQPQLPGVHFMGQVLDTTPFYANCDAAIVPLRAAAGTRIKILEAFSHQRAVVSTSIGAEGLEVTPDLHLGVADGPEAFAELCIRLIDQPDERHTMARKGHEFFRQNHTLSRLESLLPQLFG